VPANLQLFEKLNHRKIAGIDPVKKKNQLFVKTFLIFLIVANKIF